MRKTFFLFSVIFIAAFCGINIKADNQINLKPSIKVSINQPDIPIVLDRPNGILAEICIEIPKGTYSVTDGDFTGEWSTGESRVERGTAIKLENVDFTLYGLNFKEIDKVNLLYSGTASCIPSHSKSIVLHDKLRIMGANQTLISNPKFTQKISSLSKLKKYNYTPKILPGECSLPNNYSKYILDEIVLNADKRLVEGKNYFYLTLDLSSKKIKDISQVIGLKVNDIKLGLAKTDKVSTKLTSNEYEGNSAELLKEYENLNISSLDGAFYTKHRMGVKVRTYGDDNSLFYRIPGLVTTKRGTLIAVYDVRYESSQDLQADIDIGVSRSLDGGKTWEDMIIAMDMGQWGGLPDSQNGIGDPSVLYDPVSDKIFIVAAWTHGIEGGRAWSGVGNGMSPETTAQLMIVSSGDDGKTWTKPRNITQQIKNPDWYFTLQGPGRGIAMKNGNLVFPMQYKDEKTIPHSFLMYSEDHGENWKRYNAPVPETTEAQVVELPDGSLMLNMRNNTRTGRKVYTTKDYGKTWEKHPSCDKIVEPVCMASLIRVPAEDNVFNRDILLFSNPATSKGRYNMTIQISFDNGLTWSKAHKVLLDQEGGWGYSCMSMIDDKTIGILYESSVAQILFQAVKLEDLVVFF